MDYAELRYTASEFSLSVVGVIGTLIFVFVVFASLLDGIRTFVLPLWKTTNLKPRPGAWAIVTGSSSGIGKSYSCEFARLGYNVILVSNEIDALKESAYELEDEFGISTSVVCTDFSQGETVYEEIKKEIADKEIDVLVNNVGSRGNQPCYFLEESEDTLVAMDNINCLAAVAMTNLILPSMLKRDKGIIINVSSVGGLFPMNMGSVYSATKRFVDHFTRGLQEEYRHTGLVIQSIFPFYVCTKMTQFSEELATPSILVPDSDTYVKSSIRTVGIKDASTGYWPHAIMCSILISLPLRVVQYLNLLQAEMLTTKKQPAVVTKQEHGLADVLTKVIEAIAHYGKHLQRYLGLEQLLKTG